MAVAPPSQRPWIAAQRRAPSACVEGAARLTHPARPAVSSRPLCMATALSACRGAVAVAKLRAIAALSRPITPSAPATRQLAGAGHALLTPRRERREHSVRTYARSDRSDDGDKSWSEVAKDVSGAAKSVFSKIANTVKKATGQDEQTKLEKQRRNEAEELYKPPDLSGVFGGGLLGRAAGAMLGGAIKAVGQQMAEARRKADMVWQKAASAIESDSQVREYLGGNVQVGSPISQSSMSSSINGRVTQTVSLILPVVGSRGMAQAMVEASETAGEIKGLRIQMRMQDGALLDIKGGSKGATGTGQGRVIDADWTDV